MAADGCEVVGYAALSCNGDTADLLRVAVNPDRRRLGVARRLCDAILAGVGPACTRVLLEVAADNPAAMALYSRLGFVEIDRRRRYYGGAVDAVVMERALPAAGMQGARPPRGLAADSSPEAGHPQGRPRGRRSMTEQPLVLGIETSCDETGVGVVRGNTLLADAVASSVEEHARFGGVVPEVASRAHLEAMQPTIERACRAPVWRSPTSTRSPSRRARDWPGAARRPRRRQGAGAGLGKPLYGVNHLSAHVAVDQLEHGPLPEPCVALLVSGGHSSLLLVDDVTAGVEPLGATDRRRRRRGVRQGRPAAGPAVPRRAAHRPGSEGGRVDAIDFPRGLPSRRTSSGTGSTSRSAASRPPSPGGWRRGSARASRCRSPTSRRRSRRRSATC